MAAPLTARQRAAATLAITVADWRDAETRMSGLGRALKKDLADDEIQRLAIQAESEIAKLQLAFDAMTAAEKSTRGLDAT